MHVNLETLATALYVKIDDELKARRGLGPARPAAGFAPALSDAELITMAVMQSLLNIRSERRWVRYMAKNLRALFPVQLSQPGYNKRPRAALPLIQHFIRALAFDTDFWFDNHWILDSTPVECGRSRPTVQRSDAAGWAAYGYCASHSRFFWGLRLYLICTPTGLPIMWALADAKIGEREVVEYMLDREPALLADRPGLLLIIDKGFAAKRFEQDLADQGITLLRPNRKNEKQRPGQGLLKAVRQLIESVNDTLKGQLDLEPSGYQSSRFTCPARTRCRRTSRSSPAGDLVRGRHADHRRVDPQRRPGHHADFIPTGDGAHASTPAATPSTCASPNRGEGSISLISSPPVGSSRNGNCPAAPAPTALFRRR